MRQHTSGELQTLSPRDEPLRQKFLTAAPVRRIIESATGEERTAHGSG